MTGPWAEVDCPPLAGIKVGANTADALIERGADAAAWRVPGDGTDDEFDCNATGRVVTIVILCCPCEVIVSSLEEFTGFHFGCTVV
jgi:hypothetical protein